MLRTNPHILEANARTWLHKIKQEVGPQATLADVPQKYIDHLKQFGFDAIWVMGVWQESLASRAIAREEPNINAFLAKTVPGYSKEDIIGSPYSIYGYDADPLFGGNEAILKLKERLNAAGVSLVLDFSGNHLSKDHPLTLSDPDLFIYSKEEPKDKNLFFQTANGIWLAYGRDPHFPPWTDTVQVNHFSPKARELSMKRLLKLTELCDGLRCDMVMLSLNKIFKEVWGPYLKNTPEPQEEFWPKAIKKVKEKAPHFYFGAEVYWGLEWEVQEAGFDYTYDKVLYDRLLLSSPQEIACHLGAEHLYQRRSIRFISNHDEQAPIAAFGPQKSRAAAAVVATISGMRLFTAGQLRGDPVRLPIQYIQKDIKVDSENLAFYEKLLKIVNHPCFHGGQIALKYTLPIDENDTSNTNILCWAWSQFTTCKTILINYSNHPARCFLTLDKVPAAEKFIVKEEFSGKDIEISTAEIRKTGLRLELAPFEVKIFTADF